MVDDRVLDSMERSLAEVIRLLTDRAVTGNLARISGFDLPPASWSLLEYLASDGPVRVSDIAACQGVDVSTVTPRLKNLEAQGLVSREREPSDARAFRISIAPQGEAALGNIHAARRDILRDAVERVGPDQLAGAEHTLRSIAHHLAPST
ncbi:MAG: MarR family winged helix-turn-helix transcriptional regulator [Mycobacteriaceae bacterium]|uniref:MarR family winged helix-turn-helix transcriptional regulator n=1 Tax=Corynebacterium sp. TaxID=1720 RepID=UPI003F9D0BB2